MNNASIDVDARRTFREELRGRRVALRSFIPRDDIDDVEIVEAEDPEVSATRQVLKVEAVERTGEIDALDVLESIGIVHACAPSETVVPVAPPSTSTASLTEAFAVGIAAPERAPLAPPVPIAAIAVTETAPLSSVGSESDKLEERAPYAALDVEDDAFFAQSDRPSTLPLTFHLGDSYVDEVGPTIELAGAVPVDRRRRLHAIVGTVIACAVVMTAAAAITQQTQQTQTPSTELATSAAGAALAAAPTLAPAAANGPTVALTPATTTAYPAIPEMDVRSLPAALAGTIVGVPKRPLFVDGKRLQSSTAIVACGKHTVRSGLFRAGHLVDVPCGGSIALK